MLEPNEKIPEKPKITRPKPTIASKPKYIPPVNLKVTPKADTHLRTSTNGKDAFLTQHGNIYVKNIDFSDKCPESTKYIPQHQSFKSSSHETPVGAGDSRSRTTIKINEIERKFEKLSVVAPNSPSTVCCSILSNSAGDCCGIMGHKKEMTSKSMTKIDSLDSNSSDSGGFKDFIQLDSVKKISFDMENGKFERKIDHQRKFSQPDFLEKSVSERAKTLSQSFCERKAMSESEDNRRPLKTEVPPIGRLPKQNVVQNFTDKTEEKLTSKPKAPVVSSTNLGQFKQSKKHLEELLAQRIENEKQRQKKLGMSGPGGDSTHPQDFEQQMAVQKNFQQKLQADLKQTVKQIQEIQSIELRLPQNRSWDSNRSQPAIGLKHTPKSRPTIFGTVASDLTPKDGSNRRSLPQTPQSSKNFSALYNGETGPGIDHIPDHEIHQDNALVYRDGNLISGSLEALIQHMVPTDIYYPDRAYLFAFLLSSRLFIKPHELLAKIRQLCEIQQGLGSAGTQHGPATARFAEHLVQLLAEWTETFPYDFRDERVMQHIRVVTQQCMTLNQSLRSTIPVLLQNLQQRLKTLEAYEKSLDQNMPFDENQPSDITEVCTSPATLAQQLTHMELERLSFIGPEEFVQAFAKDNPHIETSFKDMKKTRNLEQYVQWFNRLSYFVATQVCKHPKKKQRVRVVEYWIETARECFNIGNFNSLMAIIAGLNMSPISRLKKTWHKIQSGKFSILEHQMDPSSNFSSYRSTLKAAMWRSAGATDQRQRIVIPFFSLLVKDLYFLNEGCSNKLPNGHINFEKFWQLAKQVTEFMAWKQVACPFEKETRVISLLQRGAVLSENGLALASFECEPPENNQERERCKSLKAEHIT